MPRAWREEGEFRLGLHRLELAVITNFVDVVADRVRVEEEEASDPFALWERGLGEGPATEPEEERDPLLDRLFPQVYPDDPRASAEHRRYSEDELRARMAREADLVLDALEAAKGHVLDPGAAEPLHVVAVRPAELDAWLRTLNTTRLALAVELDITNADDAEALAGLPDDDERIYPWSVYEFLGDLQGFLLALQGY